MSEFEVFPGAVLTIPNRHHVSCGEPPNITPTQHQAVWYWENQYGDQVVFMYDTDTKKATLWHGDIGWKPIDITGGSPVDTNGVFSELELSFIHMFWAAMTAHFGE